MALISWLAFQSQEGLDFIAQNILAIGIIALLMFVYLVFLVRKRWRKGFLHDTDKKTEK